MYKLMKICISTVAMFFIATVFNPVAKMAVQKKSDLVNLIHT